MHAEGELLFSIFWNSVLQLLSTPQNIFLKHLNYSSTWVTLHWKNLKHYAIPHCFWGLWHSPLNRKYCAWFFQLITLKGSVLVLQMLHLSEVMCCEVNLNLRTIVLECLFYSSFVNIRSTVKEIMGQKEKLYTVGKSVARQNVDTVKWTEFRFYLGGRDTLWEQKFLHWFLNSWFLSLCTFSNFKVGRKGIQQFLPHKSYFLKVRIMYQF